MEKRRAHTAPTRMMSSAHEDGNNNDSLGLNTNSNMQQQVGNYAYEEVSVIGNGAYGVVFRGRDLKNPGRYVALKRIRVNFAQDEGTPMCTIREIAMLRQIDAYQHPNIVRFLDVCQGHMSAGEMHLILVFEYIDQDLSRYMEKCPPPGLHTEVIMDLMHQILCGVDFLHMNRIVHRDLKPQNVLISNHGRVKLADFGLARIYSFQMALTSVVVTLWYRAPEVILTRQYGTAIDMWSCGCILAELFTLVPVFRGDSDYDQLRQIFRIIGLPSVEEWSDSSLVPRESFPYYNKQPFTHIIPTLEDEANDLLERLLQFDYTKRISATDALRHPYFRDHAPPPEITEVSLPPEASAALLGDPTIAAHADPAVSERADTRMSSPTDAVTAADTTAHSVDSAASVMPQDVHAHTDSTINTAADTLTLETTAIDSIDGTCSGAVGDSNHTVE